MSEEKKKLAFDVIYGQKAGMTRIFGSDGQHIPVTVIKIIPNYISQVKTVKKDGYSAYQIAYYEKREKLLNSPLKGHLKKGKISQFFTRFAEVKDSGASEENLGSEIGLGSFPPNTYIDVSGVSKGKGFQGVIKKYNFAGGPASHGSHFHRRLGSVGNRATPGRIFKQKKMPGHMGSEKLTVQNLKVVEVNHEKGYLLIKGSVPGAKNSFVRIAKAIKK